MVITQSYQPAELPDKTTGGSSTCNLRATPLTKQVSLGRWDLQVQRETPELGAAGSITRPPLEEALWKHSQCKHFCLLTQKGCTQSRGHKFPRAYLPPSKNTSGSWRIFCKIFFFPFGKCQFRKRGFFYMKSPVPAAYLLFQKN